MSVSAETSDAEHSVGVGNTEKPSNVPPASDEDGGETKKDEGSAFKSYLVSLPVLCLLCCSCGRGSGSFWTNRCAVAM